MSMSTRNLTIGVVAVAAVAIAAYYLWQATKPNVVNRLTGTAYTVTLSVATDGSNNCMQQVSGQNTPYVTVSVKNGDTIHYQGIAAGMPPTVFFPLQNEVTGSSPFPGTPFKDPSGSGHWGFKFLGSDTPSDKFAPVLTAQESSGDIYFPYSQVIINNKSCNLPVDGMGVHVQP
jgi:hypothetical protein